MQSKSFDAACLCPTDGDGSGLAWMLVMVLL